MLARGESFVRDGVEDVVFCYLRFPSGRVAHMHLSWLDPHKERRFTVVGLEADGDLRRHGARAQGDGLRQGLRPRLPQLRRVHHALGRRDEPADLERGAAADRVPALRRVRAHGRRAALRVRPAGLRAVRVLEALQRSLDAGGAPQRLEPAPAPREALRPPVGARARADARPRRGARGRRSSSARGVVIHSGTVVGDGCEIQDGAVLGKRPRLGARSTRAARATRAAGDRRGRRRLRRRGRVRGRADRRRRDRRRPGAGARARRRSARARVIGRGMRHRQRRHDRRGRPDPVELLPRGARGDRGRRVRRAWGGHDQRRHDGPPRPPVEPLRARRCAARAGSAAGVVLTPGVEIGEEAFIAAGAVVTRDVPAARGRDGRARRARCARCRTRTCCGAVEGARPWRPPAQARPRSSSARC